MRDLSVNLEYVDSFHELRESWRIDWKIQTVRMSNIVRINLDLEYRQLNILSGKTVKGKSY